ncbi:hypothetical protein [Selenomonas ruminantium]|uniref:hypothetical protein n=1 Tax=Selenomonas ruminantium TaxID=971 RepID=UPI00047DB00C|nr:hypothetical protein [Selenomonas ruminantium]
MGYHSIRESSIIDVNFVIGKSFVGIGLNFEGGCYNLDMESEPDIYGAIKPYRPYQRKRYPCPRVDAPEKQDSRAGIRIKCGIRWMRSALT